MTCVSLFCRITRVGLLGLAMAWSANASGFESPDGDPSGATEPLAPEARATNEAADRALGADVPRQPVADEEVPPTDSPIIGDGITQTQEPLSPEMTALRSRVRRALGMYHQRPLNTVEHNPWEVMHGIIAYGVDAQLRRGGVGEQVVNGIAYVSINGPCRGLELLQLDERGRLSVRIGPYVQGHAGQLLAILAQCHVPATYPIRAAGRQFTLQDLIETEQQTCEPDSELTFKLIGLSHYLDSDATWQDQRGRPWSIARLVREEIRQPILYTAACGGTHRLMGLSYSIYKRRQQGKPINGEFARAQKYLYDYHRYAFALQNQDGSFSTEWFKGPGNRPDLDRKIKTTGHILEWLSFSLPEKHLSDPRMLRAVNFIASSLVAAPEHAWEIGPHGHAIHALRIYYRRRFRPYDEASRPATTPLAVGPTTPAKVAGGASADADSPQPTLAKPVTTSDATPSAVNEERTAPAAETEPVAAATAGEQGGAAEGAGDTRGEAITEQETVGPVLEAPHGEPSELVIHAETPDETATAESAASETVAEAEETVAAETVAQQPVSEETQSSGSDVDAADDAAAGVAGPALVGGELGEPAGAVASEQPVADPAASEPSTVPAPVLAAASSETDSATPSPEVAAAPPMAAASDEMTAPAEPVVATDEAGAGVAAMELSTESIPAIEGMATPPGGPERVAEIPALRRDKRQPAPPTKPAMSPLRVPKGTATVAAPSAGGASKTTAKRPQGVRRQAAKPRGQATGPDAAYK